MPPFKRANVIRLNIQTGGTKLKRKSKLPAIYLTLILVLMYLPILLIVFYSFNENKLSSTWGGFSLKWYGELFRDKEIFKALINSLVLASLSSLAAGVIGTLGAVGLPKSGFRSKGAIEYVATLPIMIPEIILAMVFMAFFSLLGLPFGMTTLVIAHTTFCVPYVYMLVKARLVGMDASLCEAAQDLGAGSMRAFFDITLPLISPAIASGMFLSFAMSLDDVIISLFVTGVNVNTLPIKIYTQVKTGLTPKVNALCTLMLAVTIIVVVLSTWIGHIKKPTIGVVEETKSA